MAHALVAAVVADDDDDDDEPAARSPPSPKIRLIQTRPGPSSRPSEMTRPIAAPHRSVTLDSALFDPMAQSVVDVLAPAAAESDRLEESEPEPSSRPISRCRLIQTRPGPETSPNRVSPSEAAENPKVTLDSALLSRMAQQLPESLVPLSPEQPQLPPPPTMGRPLEKVTPLSRARPHTLISPTKDEVHDGLAVQLLVRSPCVMSVQDRLFNRPVQWSPSQRKPLRLLMDLEPPVHPWKPLQTQQSRLPQILCARTAIHRLPQSFPTLNRPRVRAESVDRF